MPTVLALDNIDSQSDSTAAISDEYTCYQAYKHCMPSFVFSIAGQVGFRSALDHLLTCTSRDCSTLRKKVKDGMYDKLIWLYREKALLGCIHVQPVLYSSRSVVDIRRQNHFMSVADHLSLCPHESCARLRRAMLLTIRDSVSPNARN